MGNVWSKIKKFVAPVGGILVAVFSAIFAGRRRANRRRVQRVNDAYSRFQGKREERRREDREFADRAKERATRAEELAGQAKQDLRESSEGLSRAEQILEEAQKRSESGN